MRGIKFIHFGEFAPDSREVDAEQMELAVGLIPLNGEYRSMARFRELSQIEDVNPVNGSLVHLVTPERSNQEAEPFEDAFDLTLSGWIGFGDTLLGPPDAEDDEAWWRLTSPPQELTGIRLSDPAFDAVEKVMVCNLSIVEDPNTDEGHFLRMRYRVNHPEALDAWTLKFELSDITLIATLEVTDVTAEGTGWQTIDYELTPLEVATITNYDDFQGAMKATLDYPAIIDPLPVPLVAVGNETPGFWTIEPDDDEELTKIGVLSDTDDDTYLTQDGFGAKAFQALLLDVVEPADTGNPGTNWELFADCGSPETDIDVTITLLELEDEISVVTGSVPANPTTVTRVSGVLPELEVAEIEDYSKLSIRVEVAPDAAGAELILRPNANKQVINFTAEPSGQIWEVVSDEDDGTWAEASSDAQFGCQLPTPGTTPPDGANVTVKAKVETVGGRCKFKLRFGDGVSGDLFTWQSGYVQNDEVTLSSGSNSPSSVDWPSAYLEVLTINTAGGTQIKVIEAWVETEGPSVEFEAKVAATGLLSPTETAGVEVCFIEYDLPISKPQTPGDTAAIYAGNLKSIYEVSSTSGFQDVSKTSNASYGEATAAPTGWHFASWGNRVIGTNGSDPVQWQEDPTERFVDLMDVAVEPTTEIFTARYVAIARDFVFLGNCLHPTDPEVGEYTIWWSDINNPRLYLFVDPAHLSDFQSLVSTAGAITGLSGGEFISISKRTSIYRGTFVGPPLIWDIQVASYQEGTMYGSSMVAIDRDLFFFGSGGFRHLPYGSGVRPIGDGKVTRMFTDKIYEDRSLKQFYTDDVTEAENSLIGTYDEWSRLIFWLYRGIGDNAYKNRMGIVYNPWTDNWSVLDLPLSNTTLRPPELVADAGYSHLNSLPTLPTDDRSATRGVTGFGYTGTEITYERSLQTKHYDVHLRTKKLSSGAISGREGQNLKIHAIRFIISQDQALGVVNFQAPQISATIIGSKDVNFSCGVVQETVVSGSDNEDESGWLTFDDPLPGEFFVVDAKYSIIEDELISDLIGFEVDYEAGSRK